LEISGIQHNFVDGLEKGTRLDKLHNNFKFFRRLISQVPLKYLFIFLFQVLHERTHPRIMMPGNSGYLLTGIKVSWKKIMKWCNLYANNLVLSGWQSSKVKKENSRSSH